MMKNGPQISNNASMADESKRMVVSLISPEGGFRDKYVPI